MYLKYYFIDKSIIPFNRLFYFIYAYYEYYFLLL